MPNRPRRVVGNQDENLIVEALMNFFEVAPVEAGRDRLWPRRAIDSAGAVLNILPPEVRQELSAVISHEYVEQNGVRSGYRTAGPPPPTSPWFDDAREFATARFRFYMETGA